MAQKITVREQKQLHYSIRQRRVNGIFTLYSVLLYSAYTIFVFIDYNSNQKQFRLNYILGLLIAPFTIWLIRRLISWWFNRLTSSNAEYINALRSEQQEKIEDLKQSTNFYSTKALLEGFDSSFDKTSKRKSMMLGNASKGPGGPSGKPNGEEVRPDTGHGPSPPGIELSPQSKKPTHRSTKSIAAEDFEFAPNLPSLQSSPNTKSKSPNEPDTVPPGANSPLRLRENFQRTNSMQMQMQMQQPQDYPLGPVYNANYQPSWYDKILDIIVGEDEYSPKSRYALICGNCRRHNGLAQPGELPQYVIYICPQCGFRNGQEKKKRKESKPTIDDSDYSDSTPQENTYSHKHRPATQRQPSHKKLHTITKPQDESDENNTEEEDSKSSSRRHSSTNLHNESSEYASNEESSVEEVKYEVIDEKPEKTNPGLHRRKKSRKGK